MGQTMQGFVEEHGITLELLDGPDYTRDAEGWEHNLYRVELRHEARTMIVPWRQGLGITDDPEPATVLDSIASDTTGVETVGGFEDWAAEYGLDTDSRKAERTYSECREQARKLRALLGDDLTSTLLDDVERL